MSHVKKTIGAISLIILMPLFAKQAYTQSSPKIERTAKPEQVKKLTKDEMESLRQNFINFNAKIRKEISKQGEINSNQNYNIIQPHQLYNPQNAKFTYGKTSNFGEDKKKNIKWYVGGELTKRRDIKDIQISAEMNNFGFKAFIDPIHNKRIFNFRTNKGRNSLEVIVGNNNLLQGKIGTTLPKIAEINIFYDFNNNQFNYSVSRSYKGMDFNVAQQFRNGLTITSANIGYALEKIGLPGKLKINYILINKNQKNQFNVILQEKILFLNLEARFNNQLIPSITGSISRSWN